MGFVGGGDNIAIATALSLSLLVYCIANIKWFMDFLNLVFYGCLRLRFLDVETNPGLRRPVCLSMIYCCAQRLLSQICIACRSCRFTVLVALSCCVGTRCLGPMEWWHMYEMATEHLANPNLSVVVVKCWFLGFVV